MIELNCRSNRRRFDYLIDFYLKFLFMLIYDTSTRTLVSVFSILPPARNFQRFFAAKLCEETGFTADFRQFQISAAFHPHSGRDSSRCCRHRHLASTTDTTRSCCCHRRPHIFLFVGANFFYGGRICIPPSETTFKRVGGDSIKAPIRPHHFEDTKLSNPWLEKVHPSTLSFHLPSCSLPVQLGCHETHLNCFKHRYSAHSHAIHLQSAQSWLFAYGFENFLIIHWQLHH